MTTDGQALRAIAAGYRVLSRLRRGPDSAVYRALREDDGAEVVLKVLLSEAYPVDDEAANLRRLPRHPHLVRVLGTGRTVHGFPFFAMEYHPEGSYADLLARSGPVSVEEAIRVGRAIASALDAAHGVGLLHRDVTPANILRGADGPLLTDFGIAALPEELSGTVALDRLTPHHAAPEALLRKAQDARSDVYGLGSTLWTLLAGHPPFASPDEPSPDPFEYREYALHRPVPPIPRDDVPPWLQDVLRRAMAKAPDDRYGDATAFGIALRDRHAGPPASTGSSTSDEEPVIQVPAPGTAPTGHTMPAAPPPVEVSGRGSAAVRSTEGSPAPVAGPAPAAPAASTAPASARPAGSGQGGSGQGGPAGGRGPADAARTGGSGDLVNGAGGSTDIAARGGSAAGGLPAGAPTSAPAGGAAGSAARRTPGSRGPASDRGPDAAVDAASRSGSAVVSDRGSRGGSTGASASPPAAGSATSRSGAAAEGSAPSRGLARGAGAAGSADAAAADRDAAGTASMADVSGEGAGGAARADAAGKDVGGAARAGAAGRGAAGSAGAGGGVGGGRAGGAAGAAGAAGPARTSDAGGTDSTRGAAGAGSAGGAAGAVGGAGGAAGAGDVGGAAGHGGAAAGSGSGGDPGRPAGGAPRVAGGAGFAAAAAPPRRRPDLASAVQPAPPAADIAPPETDVALPAAAAAPPAVAPPAVDPPAVDLALPVVEEFAPPPAMDFAPPASAARGQRETRQPSEARQEVAGGSVDVTPQGEPTAAMHTTGPAASRYAETAGYAEPAGYAESMGYAQTAGYAESAVYEGYSVSGRQAEAAPDTGLIFHDDLSELDGDDPPSGNRRGASRIAVGVAALVIGLSAVLVGSLVYRTLFPDTPEAAQIGTGAPEDVKLADERVAVTLSWRDVSEGDAIVYVVGAPRGSAPTTLASAARGSTSVRVNGLNPQVDYCFRLVAALSVDQVSTSGEACTARFAATPTPS